MINGFDVFLPEGKTIATVEEEAVGMTGGMTVGMTDVVTVGVTVGVTVASSEESGETKDSEDSDSEDGEYGEGEEGEEGEGEEEDDVEEEDEEMGSKGENEDKDEDEDETGATGMASSVPSATAPSAVAPSVLLASFHDTKLHGAQHKLGLTFDTAGVVTWVVPDGQADRRRVAAGMRLAVVDGVLVDSRDSVGDRIKAFRERHMHDDQPPRIPFEVSCAT